jgi:hypothetical protein
LQERHADMARDEAKRLRHNSDVIEGPATEAEQRFAEHLDGALPPACHPMEEPVPDDCTPAADPFDPSALL